MMGSTMVVGSSYRMHSGCAASARAMASARLKHHRHFLADAAQFGFREVGDLFMRHNDTAIVRLEESHNMRQCHGFTNAAASDNSHRVAGIYVKIAVD